MPRTHRIYERDLREEAINVLLSSGRPLKRVAVGLGISANSLRTWPDRALGKGSGAETAAERPLPMRRGNRAERDGLPQAVRRAERKRRQIRRLQREVDYLRRQREILKKP